FIQSNALLGLAWLAFPASMMNRTLTPRRCAQTSSLAMSLLRRFQLAIRILLPLGAALMLRSRCRMISRRWLKLPSGLFTLMPAGGLYLVAGWVRGLAFAGEAISALTTRAKVATNRIPT